MSLDKKKKHHKSRWSKIRIAGLSLFVCPLWDNVEKKISKWTFITRPAKLKELPEFLKKEFPLSPTSFMLEWQRETRGFCFIPGTGFVICSRQDLGRLLKVEHF